MTNKHGAEAKVQGGIRLHLADASSGRRSVRWLSQRTGIPYSTLQNKLRNAPGKFTTDDLFRIADALDTTIVDLYSEVAA